MLLKIERLANRGALYILSGQMDVHQAIELDMLFLNEPAGTQIVMDLKDLTVVDRAAVCYLRLCEAGGMILRNSPAYIRAWIDRERCFGDELGERREAPNESGDE